MEINGTKKNKMKKYWYSECYITHWNKYIFNGRFKKTNCPNENCNKAIYQWKKMYKLEAWLKNLLHT